MVLKYIMISFRKNIGLLKIMTGSLLSQALPFILLPILSRKFGADVMGEYSLFISIYSVLIIVSTLRYELAIVTEKDNYDSKTLVQSSIIIAILMSLFFFIFILIYKNLESNKIGILGNFIYLLPISLLFGAIMQVSINDFNRNSNYFNISLMKFLFSVTSSVFPFVLVQFCSKNNVVIISFIAGQLLASVFAVHQLKKRINLSMATLKNSFNLPLLIRHKEYPFINLPSSILDALAGAIPIFYITNTFGSNATGYFGFMTRVLMTPSSLIQFTFATYFFGKFADLNRTGIKFRNYLFKTIFFLFIILLLPFLLLQSYGNEIFYFVFGNNWAESGDLSSIYSIAALLKTIISPFILTFAVVNKLKVVALWQFCYFLANLLLVFYQFVSIENYVIALTIIDVVFYLSCAYLLFKYSNINE